MIEKSFAVVMVVLCVAALIREAIGARRRQRLDAAVLRAWHIVRGAVLRLYRWPSTRRRAADTAAEAIRRARGEVKRDGNVYRPKSFRGHRDDD
jgi:hypothetical protein